MKKIILIAVVCVFCVLGYNAYIRNANLYTQPTPKNVYSSDEGVLYIQPLGDVDSLSIFSVDTTVQGFYHYRCVVLPIIDPTEDILTTSGKKYDCDKILSKFKGQRHILIITKKNIAHFGNEYYPEWSIWGYAYISGETALISTYLLKQDGSNKKIVRDRLDKAAIHEIGHNVGLIHCERDSRCIMNDGGKGLPELDAQCIWLCDYCRAQVQK